MRKHLNLACAGFSIVQPTFVSAMYMGGLPPYWCMKMPWWQGAAGFVGANNIKLQHLDLLLRLTAN